MFLDFKYLFGILSFSSSSFDIEKIYFYLGIAKNVVRNKYKSFHLGKFLNGRSDTK